MAPATPAALLMESAERPDQEKDRDRNTKQPQQYVSAHGLCSPDMAHGANAVSIVEFRLSARGETLVRYAGAEPAPKPGNCALQSHWAAALAARSNRIS